MRTMTDAEIRKVIDVLERAALDEKMVGANFRAQAVKDAQDMTRQLFDIVGRNPRIA